MVERNRQHPTTADLLCIYLGEVWVYGARFIYKQFPYLHSSVTVSESAEYTVQPTSVIGHMGHATNKTRYDETKTDRMRWQK